MGRLDDDGCKSQSLTVGRGCEFHNTIIFMWGMAST